MNTEQPQPGKFWAYVAAIVGGLLLLSGIAAVIGYLGLPFVFFYEDMLGWQLGQMAGMFLGLICGGLAIYHGLGSIRNKASRPMKLPPVYAFWISFALVLGLGNVLLNFEIAEVYLFPPLFLLGAALPTLAVLAWASRSLGWPISWRQASLALTAGSTLSIVITIVLDVVIPYLAYLLIPPLDFLTGSFTNTFSRFGILERLFFSPWIIPFLVSTALQAPIPEEFAKVVGVVLFGRRRIHKERQAFMLGMTAGAGFAILENMLYQGLYAQWSGWSWGGITLLRGIGSVLHPLGTGLVALGWFRAREAGWGQLWKVYAVAVGMHTLWNGGFMTFVYLTGLDYYSGGATDIFFYGMGVEILLVVFLLFLSIGLWWLLRRLTTILGKGIIPDLTPTMVSRRTLAVWAFVCVLVIVPIGAALGPAWGEIRSLMLLRP